MDRVAQLQDKMIDMVKSKHPRNEGEVKLDLLDPETLADMEADRLAWLEDFRREQIERIVVYAKKGDHVGVLNEIMDLKQNLDAQQWEMIVAGVVEAGVDATRVQRTDSEQEGRGV